MSEEISENEAKKRCHEVNQAFNELQPQNSQSPYYTQLSHEEKKIYDNKMASLSNAQMSALTLCYHAAWAIKCSYTDEELKGNLEAVQAIKDSYRSDALTIEFLKKRIQQPFNCRYGEEKRIQMMALVDLMQTMERKK